MSAAGGGRLLRECVVSAACCSLSPDRPSLGRSAGVRYPQAVSAGDVGVGTRHQPHSARSCELALPAVGAARGRPGGGVASLAWLWGFRAGALSYARPPVLEACGRCPLPSGCGRGRWARGDPSLTPQRALLRTGFDRCGGGTRAPGWGVFCLGVGRPGLGALPPLTVFLEACGRSPLSTGCGSGGCERGDTSTTPQRALLRAGFTCCAGGMRAPGGGGVSCLNAGRPGLGALFRPTARPWGVRSGSATHRLWVREVCVWGPVTDPTVRALENCL